MLLRHIEGYSLCVSRWCQDEVGFFSLPPQLPPLLLLVPFLTPSLYPFSSPPCSPSFPLFPSLSFPLHLLLLYFLCTTILFPFLFLFLLLQIPHFLSSSFHVTFVPLHPFFPPPLYFFLSFSSPPLHSFHLPPIIFPFLLFTSPCPTHCPSSSLSSFLISPKSLSSLAPLCLYFFLLSSFLLHYLSVHPLFLWTLMCSVNYCFSIVF